MARDQDPYDVLGLSRNASCSEVARAYRRAARATHPDGPEKTASVERFQAVNDAYEALRVERAAARPIHGVEEGTRPLTNGWRCWGMTSLLVRDPFLAAPFRLMDELMRSAGNGKGVTGFTPALDVHETEEEYWVRVDLPGVKSEDVNVEINDNVLSIVGSRVPADSGSAQILERSYGSFARTLTLPKGVDSDAIEAGYQDGVLELRIPKPAERKPKKIAIGASTVKAIEK